MTSMLRQQLQEHRAVCQELLAALEREAHCLQTGELDALSTVDEVRQRLLPRLGMLTGALKQQRRQWEQLPPEQRRWPAEVQSLLQENQELVHRLLAMDRENERLRLRHGLVPLQHLPAATPPAGGGGGYVAEIYRRHGAL